MDFAHDGAESARYQKVLPHGRVGEPGEREVSAEHLILTRTKPMLLAGSGGRGVGFLLHVDAGLGTLKKTGRAIFYNLRLTSLWRER